MYGGRPIKGLGQAVWWAAVTMTTVGYGDKAPKTLGGRVVAVAWMLASIVKRCKGAMSHVEAI